MASTVRRDRGDDLVQGQQVAAVRRPCRAGARRPVGQVLDPLQHAHGQPLAAGGAALARPPCLGRLQADAAVPVAAQVVPARFGKQLDRPLEPVPALQRVADGEVVQLGVELGRLPAEP
jgi:hypothetical protein